MLMLAPTYWVMALARVIQGVSSSMVWVVALALLYVVSFVVSGHSHKGNQSLNRCDTTPERYIGREYLSCQILVSFVFIQHTRTHRTARYSHVRTLTWVSRTSPRSEAALTSFLAVYSLGFLSEALYMGVGVITPLTTSESSSQSSIL